MYFYTDKCSLKCNGKMSWCALCEVCGSPLRWCPPHTHTHTRVVSCYICSLKKNLYVIVTKVKWILTSVRTGYKRKLAFILVSIQVLQGADNLATLCCIHTAYLQPGQVIPHVSVNSIKKNTPARNCSKERTYSCSMCKCT